MTERPRLTACDDVGVLTWKADGRLAGIAGLGPNDEKNILAMSHDEAIKVAISVLHHAFLAGEPNLLERVGQALARPTDVRTH